MRLGSVTTPGTFAMGAPPLNGGSIIAIRPVEAIAKAESGVLYGHGTRSPQIASDDGRSIGRRHHAGGGPVKWSTGTELPKLKAPAHACDCHHYLYDSRYPVDRRGIMFPGNASIADYRALQRRLGITRQVVVQPSAYGVDNRPVLAALAAFGREARGVVVVDDNISDAELRRMHERGVRAIQFNFGPPGPTPPAMIEPLARPFGELGSRVEVNVWPGELPAILPSLARLPA